MLTFKQSVITLVSIITILAIIAVVTGLSPLYWPRSDASTIENNTSNMIIERTIQSSTLNVPITTRLKPILKKPIPTTTYRLVTGLLPTTTMTLANTTMAG